MVELAAAVSEGRPLNASRIAAAQGIPSNFLENILAELRNGGLVRSRRGSDGGFLLAGDASEITLADVIRVVDGPLASVRGAPPEEAHYTGACQALPRLWIAVRASLREVLEHVTIADVASGNLPHGLKTLIDDPDAWTVRRSSVLSSIDERAA